MAFPKIKVKKVTDLLWGWKFSSELPNIFIWIVFKIEVYLLYPKRGPKSTEMLFYGCLYGDSCPFERRDGATCSKKVVLGSVQS